MADRLVKIEPEHWQELRDLHLPTHAENYFGYCLVDNYIRWFEQDPESVDVVFYSLNGDWSDGLFLAQWDWEKGRDTIHVNNLRSPRDRLVKLVRLIDFSRRINFKSIGESALEAVAEVIKSKHIKIEVLSKGYRYFLPRSEALNIHVSTPEDVILKPMTPADVCIAHEAWPHKKPGSLEMFQKMAKFGVHVGAFDSNGQLIAWALRWIVGDIAALQVDEQYRGKGLGTLVAKAISRKIAETGHDVCANVFDTNKPSQGLFRKLGFTSHVNSFWIFTFATEEKLLT